jgi:heptosyltransferase II
MNILIIKLGATGDVVRTTPLLHRLPGAVTWITAEKNKSLIQNIGAPLRPLSWEERLVSLDQRYNLVISLEDEIEVGEFLQGVSYDRVFGAYLNGDKSMQYSLDAQGWFDLSLISRFGRQQADWLKLKNRSTYQEHIFRGLGLSFVGEKYILPEVPPSPLQGDVAISPVAGAVWPMKAWAHYDALKSALESQGFTVNVLPTRPTLLQHLADVQGHRVLVSGDSLPMHLALGSGVRCVSLFSCTSPWEIYDYGIQSKIVSPLLDEFFYKRGFDPRATTAIPFDQVLDATIQQLELCLAPSSTR